MIEATPPTDTFIFSFRYQSGFQPPGDIPFEDLSKVDTESTHNSQINNAMNHNATMKGTLGAKNLKKRVGIFNIFSSNKVGREKEISPRREPQKMCRIRDIF